MCVNFITVFHALFVVRKSFLAAFSSYILSLAKNLYKKRVRKTLMNSTSSIFFCSPFTPIHRPVKRLPRGPSLTFVHLSYFISRKTSTIFGLKQSSLLKLILTPPPLQTKTLTCNYTSIIHVDHHNF